MKAILALMLTLFATSVACRAAGTVLPAFAEPSPTPTLTPVPSPTPQPTVTPQPTQTPPPTITPAPTEISCVDGDCITACYRQLPPIAIPADLKSRRASRPVKEEYGELLVSYRIQDDQLTDPVEGRGLPAWLKPFQQDRESQRQVWDYFVSLFPPEQRKFLSEYHVFSDGEDGILAMVAQTESNMNEWTLEVDLFDSANAQDLTGTLIHEFAHLLSLNPEQVTPSLRIFNNQDDYDIYESELQACDTYFPGEGCSLQESYINQFYERFWIEIESEWEKVDQIEDEDAYYEALDRFFVRHDTEFVTGYAVTNTSEDFAESFTVFIVEPKPTGKSVADQKVLFFYEYPEFVQMRERVGRTLCARLEK